MAKGFCNDFMYVNQGSTSKWKLLKPILESGDKYWKPTANLIFLSCLSLEHYEFFSFAQKVKGKTVVAALAKDKLVYVELYYFSLFVVSVAPLDEVY